MTHQFAYGRPQELLPWEYGIFKRSTSGMTWLTSANIASVGVDTRRVASGLVAGRSLTLLESQRTNAVARCNSLTGWAASGVPQPTPGAAVGPDGALSGALIAWDGAPNDRVTRTLTDPDNTIVSQQAWYKAFSGTGNFRFHVRTRANADSASILAATAGSVWTRYRLQGVSVGSGASNPQFWHRAPADAAASSVLQAYSAWEVGYYCTSPIDTDGGAGAVTRGPDAAMWLPNEVPDYLCSGRFLIPCATHWRASDLQAGEKRIFLSFGTGALNDLIWNADTDAIELVLGGVVACSYAPPSWLDLTLYTVYVDLLAGRVGIDGTFGTSVGALTLPRGTAVRAGGGVGAFGSELDGGIDGVYAW